MSRVVFNCNFSNHFVETVGTANNSHSVFSSPTSYRIGAVSAALGRRGQDVEIIANLSSVSKAVTNFPSIQLMLDGEADLQCRDFALTPKRYEIVDFAHPTRVWHGCYLNTKTTFELCAGACLCYSRFYPRKPLGFKGNWGFRLLATFWLFKPTWILKQIGS